MWDEILALSAAVRQLQAEIKPLLPPEPPPVVPTEEVEKAQRDFDNAVAEVKNQQDRAAANIKAAQDNEAKAKAILDKSKAAEQAAHPAPANPAPRK